jgi:hypothetical protein
LHSHTTTRHSAVGHPQVASIPPGESTMLNRPLRTLDHPTAGEAAHLIYQLHIDVHQPLNTQLLRDSRLQLYRRPPHGAQTPTRQTSRRVQLRRAARGPAFDPRVVAEGGAGGSARHRWSREHALEHIRATRCHCAHTCGLPEPIHTTSCACLRVARVALRRYELAGGC